MGKMAWHVRQAEKDTARGFVDNEMKKEKGKQKTRNTCQKSLVFLKAQV